MARLLIRSGKDPFTPVSAETTLVQDVFNSNTGNFLFQHAVWRHLSVVGNELVSNSTLSERRPPEPEHAAVIDEQFDHFVVPLANAFRPDFVKALTNLTDLITQLSIPVTVVGVGAQSGHDLRPQGDADVDAAARRFVSAVLDRSASIGVRGEFTRDYLVGLGFPASSIDVIGCPSLFLHGREHRVHRAPDAPVDDSRLALNLTPEVPGIGAFATTQAARHPNLVYVGQDRHDLKLLLWGAPFPHVDDPDTPTHIDHRLYREGRYVMFVDSWPWFDFLADRDFVYGTRFHGNVAGLLAGTPSLLLTHDSRTLELARYHEMPYVEMPRFDRDVQVRDLYEQTDLTAFNTAMPERFDRYVAFLERNGLTHRFGAAEPDPAFDDTVARTTFARRVEPLGHDVREVADRLLWLRNGMVLDITRHPERYQYPFQQPDWHGAGSRFARRDAELRAKVAQLARASKEIDRLRSRQEALTERLARLEQARWRARLGRLRRRLTGLLRRS